MEVNLELLSKQLDELEKLIDKKVEASIKKIEQEISQSFKGVQDDLKTQIGTLRREVSSASKLDSKLEAAPEPEPAHCGSRQPLEPIAPNQSGAALPRSLVTHAGLPTPATPPRALRRA